MKNSFEKESVLPLYELVYASRSVELQVQRLESEGGNLADLWARAEYCLARMAGSDPRVRGFSELRASIADRRSDQVVWVRSTGYFDRVRQQITIETLDLEIAARSAIDVNWWIISAPVDSQAA